MGSTAAAFGTPAIAGAATRRWFGVLAIKVTRLSRSAGQGLWRNSQHDERVEHEHADGAVVTGDSRADAWWEGDFLVLRCRVCGEDDRVATEPAREFFAGIEAYRFAHSSCNTAE